MCPIFISYSFLMNTQIIAVIDETDAEQKQKQTCCKPMVCNPFASVSASLNSAAYYN